MALLRLFATTDQRIIILRRLRSTTFSSIVFFYFVFPFSFSATVSSLILFFHHKFHLSTVHGRTFITLPLSSCLQNCQYTLFPCNACLELCATSSLPWKSQHSQISNHNNFCSSATLSLTRRTWSNCRSNCSLTHLTLHFCWYTLIAQYTRHTLLTVPRCLSSFLHLHITRITCTWIPPLFEAYLKKKNVSDEVRQSIKKIFWRK